MRGSIRIDNNKIRWGMSALFALLILFGTYHSVFSLAAFAICGMMIFFFDREFILLQMFFILPLANIFKMSPGTQSFFTILLLVYVALHLVLPRKATALIVLFAVYLIIGELFYGQFNLFRTIKMICNILFLSSVLNSRVKINLREAWMSYIIGNLIASFYGMIDSPIFKIQAYVVFKDLGIGGFEDDVTRFVGLCGDPNYYAVNLIISLCLIVVLLHKKEIRTWAAFLLAAPFVYFIILTYSKSAIIMLMFVIVLLLYSLFTSKKFLSGGLIILSVILVFALVMSGQISALDVVIARFESSDTVSGTDINALTTGRFELWIMYIDYLIKNIKVGLLGCGISAGYLNGFGAHNTYLDIFYFLGAVGGMLLLVVLLAISGQSRHCVIRRNFLNYSVLISVLIMYFFLSELFMYDLSFHIFLVFTVLNMPLKKQKLPAQERQALNS